MSFEKSDKSSGTRHKARECALQMLFAADLIGTTTFRRYDYWSNVGLDQLYTGANDLLESVVDAADKLLLTLSSLRTIVKEVDLIDRKSSRFERLKQLEQGVPSFVSGYKAALTDFIETGELPRHELDIRVDALQRIFDAFDKDVKGVAKRTSLEKEFSESSDLYRANLDELRKRIDKVSEALSGISTAMAFADRLVTGTLDELGKIDDRIRTRAEHWRIERMAIVDRNVLRLAVYEFLYQDTPETVTINEALEIARRFSTYEATQFINGILDAIKHDLADSEKPAERSHASSI